MDIWKEYINGKDFFLELNELLEKSQEEYEIFLSFSIVHIRLYLRLGRKRLLN